MATATITKEQKAEAAKAAKADKERARKATIKAAQEAVKKAGLPEDTKLDLDQRKRAAEAAEKKAGLSGDALAKWIMEGKSTSQQVQEAKGERETAARAERQRSNLTRSNDPEAAELAQQAAALAPDVRSAFLPKEGRAFLDVILPLGGEDGAKGLLSMEVEGEDGKKETVKVTQADLRKHAQEGTKVPEVRRYLTALAKDKGTTLWGRKLGLFILARMAAEKK